MTTTTITRENFTQAMEQAVAERGRDYLYPEDDKQGSVCQYKTKNGKPSCIIGAALHILNPDFVPARGSSLPASAVLTELGVDDDRLLHAAQTAQSEQDQDMTWGFALDKFKEDLVN